LKRVAILQSNYLPWKGYFDLIRRVDEFIVLDDVQYTKNDWRNRNRVKTAGGVRWLTIPVLAKFGQTIEEARVRDGKWALDHFRTVSQAYARSPWFRPLSGLLESAFARAGEMTHLSAINRHFLELVCSLLGIATPLTRSFPVEGQKTDRLIALLRATGADDYLSGPSARAYLECDKFRAAGIGLSLIDYEGYPEYPQLFPPFEHAVTALDLVLNVGAEEAPRYFERPGLHEERLV
jgi:hypothetical protein